MGRKHTKETKTKISVSRKALKGKLPLRSEETKRKIRLSNIRTKARKSGIDVTDVTDDGLEGHIKKERDRLKLEKSAPKGWSEESRQAASERMRVRWKDPGYRKKMGKVKRLFRHTEEFKRKLAERNRAREFSHSEETKQKISEANVRRWANSTFKYKGYVNTKKGGRCGYRSLWEKHAMRLLDEDSSVESFSYEPYGVPYAMDGKARWTLPDFEVRKTDGTVVLVEVKPRSFGYGKNKVKFEACRDFCKEKGWTFEVWDERKLWPGLSQSEVREAVRHLT